MSFRNSKAESQRDSILQPRVASNELPWAVAQNDFNLNGVVSRFLVRAATPLGLLTRVQLSQGSSCLATLGWRMQSLWDCKNADLSGIPWVFYLA